MADTVSDFLVQRLSEWGVRRIYGYPGDGINGIMGALERAATGWSSSRRATKEMAAFMACGHAKFTGEVGVCLATSGPGAIHLLNGLYDAKVDHQPVLAIVGQSARSAMGGSYQQEVDLHSLFKDVAHEYVHTAMAPEQIRHLIDRSMRIAKVERTVTCLIIPHDVQDLDAVKTPPHKHGTVHSAIGVSMPDVIPKRDDLQRAADVLNAGTKVAMLVGAGAMGAADEIIRVADLLGAGVAKALLGKAALPDDIPFVTGAIGLLGTRPSWNMMQKCDTLLMVGTSFPYAEFLPEEGQARGVQIDIDGRMIGIRYPTEVNLIGDSTATLRALAPLLLHKEDRSWRQRIEDDVDEWWQLMEKRAMNDANPVNPQRVFWELSSRLPDGVHPVGRFRIGRQLVRARSQDPARHDGVALGQPGVDGAGGAVRVCREDVPSRSPGDCVRGRRRDADERPQRADHRGAPLEELDRSAFHRARAQQPGPEPGDVGTAGALGRSPLPCLAGPP